MINLTPSAISKFKALILKHPEDPVVRLMLKDVDEARLGFSITLESEAKADDEVQECDGVMVAVDATSALRMNGITLDYSDADGFKFRHPNHEDDNPLRIISLN
jgi:iron-sulfur cluster assembly accessory protein